jgi:hypothetical protein
MMHIMILFYLFYYITSHLSTIFEDQLGFVVAIKLNDIFFCFLFFHFYLLFIEMFIGTDFKFKKTKNKTKLGFFLF